jgi:hypothetical protein
MHTMMAGRCGAVERGAHSHLCFHLVLRLGSLVHPHKHLLHPARLATQHHLLRCLGTLAPVRAAGSISSTFLALQRRGGIRVRVEIMGSQKCGIVGKSQPVLIVIDPMIVTRTRR